MASVAAAKLHDRGNRCLKLSDPAFVGMEKFDPAWRHRLMPTIDSTDTSTVIVSWADEQSMPEVGVASRK